MSAQVKLRHLDHTIRCEKKRSVESMVSRLLATWVIPGVLAEMLPPASGLQRLQNHPIVTHAALTEHEHLSLAGVYGCKFRLRDKQVQDATAGWMAAKWLKEFAQA